MEFSLLINSADVTEFHTLWLQNFDQMIASSILQMISNDEYKSVEHKVVANPCEKPRVSVATFFNPGRRDGSARYGPLQELISPERPARYREFTMPEFMSAFFSKELGSKSLLEHFRSS